MDNNTILVLMVQGLFSVFLLGVGFLLRGLREDIRDIAEKMETFVTREEATPRWDRLHALGDRVIVLEAKAGMHRMAER